MLHHHVGVVIGGRVWGAHGASVAIFVAGDGWVLVVQVIGYLYKGYRES